MRLLCRAAPSRGRLRRGAGAALRRRPARRARGAARGDCAARAGRRPAPRHDGLGPPAARELHAHLSQTVRRDRPGATVERHSRAGPDAPFRAAVGAARPRPRPGRRGGAARGARRSARDRERRRARCGRVRRALGPVPVGDRAAFALGDGEPGRAATADPRRRRPAGLYGHRRHLSRGGGGPAARRRAERARLPALEARHQARGRAPRPRDPVPSRRARPARPLRGGGRSAGRPLDQAARAQSRAPRGARRVSGRLRRRGRSGAGPASARRVAVRRRPRRRLPAGAADGAQFRRFLALPDLRVSNMRSCSIS